MLKGKMEEGYFNKKDLKLCEFQFQVVHHSRNCFKVGEEVFLKSNPDHPLKIHFIDDEKIIVGRDLPEFSIPPECILQFKYRGLLIWKKKYHICIN